jgi:hypothetical protein
LEHKWTAISAIFASLVSALAAISTTYFSNSNSYELEVLKLESRSLEMKRQHFVARCESMNKLLREMSLAMPTLYMAENEDTLFDKVSKMRSDSVIARSYFSDETSVIFNESLKELIAEDLESGKKRMENVQVASLHALSKELETCNKSNVYPQ